MFPAPAAEGGQQTFIQFNGRPAGDADDGGDGGSDGGSMATTEAGPAVGTRPGEASADRLGSQLEELRTTSGDASPRRDEQELRASVPPPLADSDEEDEDGEDEDEEQHEDGEEVCDVTKSNQHEMAQNNVPMKNAEVPPTQDGEDGPTLMEQMQAASEAAQAKIQAQKEAERKRMDESFGAGLADAMKANLRRQKNRAAELDKLKNLGNTAFKESKLDEARTTYTRAIEHCKASGFEPGWYEDEAALFCNRALVALKLGDAKAAEADATEAISLRPTWAKAHVRRALALRTLGRHQDAKQCLERGSSKVSAKEKPAMEREFQKMYPDAYDVYKMPVIGGNKQRDSSSKENKQGTNSKPKSEDARWEIPEAQKVVRELEKGDWANQKLQERILANPILARGMADPRSAALFQRIQENPTAAMKEYGTTPDARAFIEEFMKTLGEHFTEMGTELEKQQVQAAVEATAPAVMTQEEAKVQREVKKVLARDDLREILSDPETQAVMQKCAADPTKLQEYMQDPKWRNRFALMRDNGLIRFE
ncbi:Stress-induced-phosphoprotein 1 [Hondaea fermentalgiana]|uniref:Stress-induced-phosphoprotein 1 n=1 Tax=Hondaea fermentalgiana TaxID=2315210 RepID=A0A2R5G735_9STRA|nr:Stress-induced-phosphoprotein 1 [Hondaea fermentalgiana]|eukprot:GBG23851.1 Stress-induced-phosphoprotein 1 [Hondaea fermentalgiana]